MCHHAPRHCLVLTLMTCAARDAYHAKIARIDKANKFAAFFFKQRVSALGVSARTIAVAFTAPFLGKARLDVCFLLCRCCGVAAMTDGTGQALSVLPVDQFVENIAVRAVPMTRLDVAVTLRRGL